MHSVLENVKTLKSFLYHLLCTSFTWQSSNKAVANVNSITALIVYYAYFIPPAAFIAMHDMQMEIKCLMSWDRST